MRYQDALKELKFKKLKKFVLVGPESYLKKSFVRAVRGLNSNAEFLVFNSDDSNEIISCLYSGALFGDRVIVIRETEKIISEEFCRALSDSKDTVIMLLSDYIDIKSKNVTKIISFSEVVECNKMKIFGNDYPLWIISKASDAGFRLEGNADKIIYERTGPSMLTIHNELKKLYLYKGDSRIITEEDVKRVVSRTSENNTYDILEQLLKRDIPKAFSSLESYLQAHENYVELVRFFAHYMEKLYRLLLLKEEGMDADGIAEVLSLPRFIVKIRYMPRALALGKNTLSKCLDWVQALEVDTRIFKGDKKVLIERFFLRFAE